MDIIWPCNCLICKYFTKPLLRALLKKELRIFNEYLEKKKVKHMAEEVHEEVRTELRKEVEELKKAVDGLKNVIAELRASLTDLTSPYALLKSMPSIPSTEEGHEHSEAEESSESKEVTEKQSTSMRKPRIIKIKTSPTPRSLSSESFKESLEESYSMSRLSPTQKSISYDESRKSVSLEELREMLKDLGEVITEEERKVTRPRLDIRRVIYILKTIYNLRKALPRESIDNIIKLAEILGLITSTDREILSTIGSLVEDALKQDLTPDEQVLVLYVLLKNLGYIDEALEEEIIRIVSNVVVSRRKIASAIENAAMKREDPGKENPSSNELKEDERKSDEDRESERRG